MNTQIQHNSKSLITSTNLGYDIEKEEINIPNKISYEESPNISININTGFAEQEPIEQVPIILQIQQENPIKLPENSILNNANTGFGTYNEIKIEHKCPEIEIPEVNEEPPSIVIIQTAKPTLKEDSILDNVDSGYGSENKVIIECKKPEFKSHLFKENYLGEFKSETEKQKVRDNLEVYSKKEVTKIIQTKTSHLITLEQLDQKLSNLDFTSSILRSYANYEIPNNLFKK